MKSVSFYNKETGIFHQTQFVVSDEKALELNTPKDHAAIDGHHDVFSKRVDVITGKVVDYQPPAPSADHEWNTEAKRWQLSSAAIAKLNRSNAARAQIERLHYDSVRAQREMLLGVPQGKERLQAIENAIVKLREDL